ncbi:TIGR00266 family protein [Desulfobacter latus]|uniref:TIGR00266 family protein n=1 Tax=Desulfobacter latus TaxID=2292 RepID=A0A850T131_9BACT|nr:TIGR00266 family protein [Desulfobacter latus]
MTTWYLSTNDNIKGPFTTDQAKGFVRENHGAYCWRQGGNEWEPAHGVAEIWPVKKNGTPFPSPPSHMMSTKPIARPVADLPVQSGSALQDGKTDKRLSPSPSRSGYDAGTDVTDSRNRSGGFGTTEFTEGIDFHIYGHEMQYIEVELDPGESAVAEAGALMYKTESIEMETVFGDAASSQSQGFMSRLMGAGQRLLTGESLFITVFTQQRQGKGRVAFAAPFPGTIIPVDLTKYQNKIICQKDSFLAGAKGVQIKIFFQKRILTGLFGGEGFIMQKIEGDGWVFMHVGGAVKEITLSPGEMLHVDTGCLAAMTATVDFDIMQAGGIKTMLFGGEGLFFARLTGPGKVWLQSLPFSRLAGRMLACSPGTGSKRQGEGSILGNLGDLAGGR